MPKSIKFATLGDEPEDGASEYHSWVFFLAVVVMVAIPTGYAYISSSQAEEAIDETEVAETRTQE